MSDYNTDMDPNAQEKIDWITCKTNEKVSAIVDEIRDIRFSMNKK